MKTRQGFVSNSSSSSFIIATKPSATITITQEVDLSNYGEVLITKEDVDRYFVSEYTYGEDNLEALFKEEPTLRMRYDRVNSLIAEGYIAYAGAVGSDYDDTVAEILYKVGFRALNSNEPLFIISEKE